MNLDRQVQLLAPATTRNNSGQYVISYTSQGDFYAALNPTYAREDNSGQQLIGVELVRWAVRYNEDVKHSWRVLHGTDNWQVIGIMHNGRKTYTTLICKLLDNGQ